jgi:preprotein translocase subunit SecA
MSILENLRSNIWMIGAKKLLKKVRKFQKNFEDMSLEELAGVFRKWKETNYVTPGNMRKRLPEIFGATVVLSKKTLFLSPYDVQILAGIAISEQNFPEMKTGEGKTLVTLLPGVLYYLAGIKLHIMTSNPYLAQRDAGKMSPPYEAIGARVAFLKQNMSLEDRIDAYRADVTYGQGHQFAFDFLNSYLVKSSDQQSFNLEMINKAAVITDEGDHVIIELSSTPIIISGPSEKIDKNYEKLQPFVARLLSEDYHHDKQMQTAHLRLSGWKKLEEQMKMNGLLSGSLADFKNRALHHAIRNLVNANFAQQEGVHYIVAGGRVQLIDQGIGRIAQGRRYSDGLHTAIEAKESSRGVKIRADNRIVAKLNFARFVRLYGRISAMSGTMKEDRDEFSDLFPTHCLMIPTNRPVIRIDHPTLLFNRRIDGVAHALKIIKERNRRGQPLLVCCSSVRDSEMFSMELHREGIGHQLLNAKQDAHEAEIVAKAGEFGAVTIGTGMVSRGTDIYLGKNFRLQKNKREKELGRELNEEEIRELRNVCDQERKAVMDAGGLFVLMFSLPSAKKIIRQFQGRSGRQGEPGESLMIITLMDPMLFPLTRDAINRNAMDTYFPASKRMHSGAQVNNVCDEVLGANAEHRYNSRENTGPYADNDMEQLVAAYEIRDHILTNKDPQYFRRFIVSLPDQPNETPKLIDQLLENKQNFSKISRKLIDIFDHEWSELIILRSALMKTSSAGNFAQKNPLDVYREESKKLFDNFIQQVKQKFSAALPLIAQTSGGFEDMFNLSGINTEDLQLDKLKDMFSKDFSQENMGKMFDGLLGGLMADEDKKGDSMFKKPSAIEGVAEAKKDNSSLTGGKSSKTAARATEKPTIQVQKTEKKEIRVEEASEKIFEFMNRMMKASESTNTSKNALKAKVKKPTKLSKKTEKTITAKVKKPTKLSKKTEKTITAKVKKPTKLSKKTEKTITAKVKTLRKVPSKSAGNVGRKAATKTKTKTRSAVGTKSKTRSAAGTKTKTRSAAGTKKQTKTKQLSAKTNARKKAKLTTKATQTKKPSSKPSVQN